MDGKKVDVEASDANLKKFRDSKDLRAGNARKNKVVQAVESFESRAGRVFDSLAREQGGIRTTEESRAIKEHYLAELVRLEYEEKNGQLLPWRDMVDEVAQEYARMRTRLIALAPEHGPRLRALASTMDDAEFVAALQELIYEALNELAIDSKDSSATTVQ
ncbi:RNA polymerase subunit sigma-70, partial [Salmonella enterica subsp. enterica serovar Pomona]|nr:RNA polymerase subunit sigma-70 [Salmonella enterica subsp. enterica serovar Pomona]EHV0233233.1 RNA polymerase subunit sigma-70 [Salmonella enterica]